MNFEPLESRQLMSVSLYNGSLNVYGNLYANNLSVSQSGATLTVNDNGAVSSYSTSGIGQVALFGNYGSDLLSVDGITINAYIDGNYGNDQITGGQGNDVLNGGYGNDTIRGGPLSPIFTLIPVTTTSFYTGVVRTRYFLGPSYPENDVISGGDGNDILSGGTGADDIHGDWGTDLVDYADRAAGVMVSLDDVANDGTYDPSTWASSEFDNVHGDVENVEGGSGNDVVYGNWLNNALFGDAGDDTLYGYGGNDVLEGSIGNDYLNAGDGNDLVRCGDGDDTAYAGTGNDQVDGMNGSDYLDAGDGNDAVLGGVGNDTACGGAGDDRIDAQAGADWVYAGDGNDTVKGGDDNDNLFGNYGNDAVYGGAGDDGLYGGDGNDTLVSIGGGQSDYVMGEGGFDSFWVDAESTETVADLSLAEAPAGHLHRVRSFFSNTVIGNGFTSVQTPSRELNGQGFMDPGVFAVTFQNGSMETPTYMNFGGTPLFGTGGPSTNDIQQGSVGDCYFLATLSATAKVNPDRIRQSVVDLGDGTCAVQFFRNGVATFVRVDSDLPFLFGTGGQAYASLRNGSKWGAVMEKAWAFFRRGDGQYASIASGTADETFGALGRPSGWWVRAPWQSAEGWMADMQNAINSGQAVTLSTGWPLSGPDLIGGHVYAVDHVNFNSGGMATSVVLRNPWATDRNGPSTDGADDGFITVSANDIYWSTLIAHFATV
jgi:Ca2+-binding RTX toxin-like protein